MRNNGVLGKQRLSFMYGLGAEPHELSRCLKESRAQLITAGARAGILPIGMEREILFLAALQPKAESVICQWFRNNAVFADGDDFLESLEAIQATQSGELEASSAKPLWRVILKAFVQQQRPPAISIFLAGAEIALQSTKAKCADTQNTPAIEVTDQDADLCLTIAEGKYIPNPARAVPTLIAGIVAAVRGEDEVAAKRRAELDSHPSPLGKKLGSALSLFETISSASRMGSLAGKKAKTLAQGKIYRPDGLPFLGVVKKVLPTGQIFVSIAGLLIDGELVEVLPAQAKQLFPSSGDATAFPSSFPKPFAEGEIGVWTAEHNSPEKSTQYVINGHLSRVYSVVRLPHPSHEPDAVRQWLLEAYKPHGKNFPVFLLSDGLALRLPGDLLDPGKFNFDMPLDSYQGLCPIELPVSRMAVVTELPIASHKYDCAPAGTCIKRLLKQRKESEGFPVLTKLQLQSLADFASASVTDPGYRSHMRALDSLEDLAALKNFLNEAVGQMLELPEIKSRIDEEKAGVIAAYTADQEDLRQKIASMAAQKRQLEAELESQKKASLSEIERLKKSVRQQEAELDKRIKSTFEKASEAGLETLAQASLLRAIIAGKGTPAALPESQDRRDSPAPARISQLPATLCLHEGAELASKRQLRRAIEITAAASGLSETMLVSAVAAARASPVIGLVGNRARKVTSILANMLADGVLCEATVTGDMFSISDLMKSAVLVRAGGQSWPATLGDFLEHQQAAGRPSLVELRGLNRAPPETLLPELAEQHLDDGGAGGICWTDKAGCPRLTLISSPTIFALTFVAGKSTFPIMHGPLAIALPVFHVDAMWGDEENSDPAAVPVPTRVALSAWLSLVHEVPVEGIGAAASDYYGPKKKLQLAAGSLGFPEAKAGAIGLLAFFAGRLPSTGIKADVKLWAPDLLAYVKETDDGSEAGLLSSIFHQEIGDISE